MAVIEIFDVLENSFKSLPGVSHVEVRRENAIYTVDIMVTDFARSIRDRIYDAQMRLMRDFEGLEFDFRVIDGSPDVAPVDAHPSRTFQ